MKLDLLNSRLVIVNPNRVYDSLEGTPITLQKPPPILSRISFRSTCPKIQPSIVSCAPKTCDNAKIDRHGTVIDLSLKLSRVKPLCSPSIIKEEVKLANQKSDPNDPNSYMPTLDRIKDHTHEYDVDSVKSRILSKQYWLI